jgi:hypothetical protein
MYLQHNGNEQEYETMIKKNDGGLGLDIKKSKDHDIVITGIRRRELVGFVGVHALYPRTPPFFFFRFVTN